MTPIDTTTSEESAGTAADACATDTLETLTAGTLTVGTDYPAYEPWFVDDDPTNGKGYESAVAFAIAEQLGFTTDEVEWVSVPFNAVVSPGDKKFDFDINQVSITEQRRKAVDFSSGYYDVAPDRDHQQGQRHRRRHLDRRPQGRQARRPGRHHELHRDHRDRSSRASRPPPFDTNDQAVQALKNGQIDGIVVDLPTAYYMTAVQLDEGMIVGQLPLPDGRRRAVRCGARQGQPADRLRHPGRRRPA